MIINSYEIRIPKFKRPCIKCDKYFLPKGMGRGKLCEACKDKSYRERKKRIKGNKK
jgi:hypothetical protein